MALIPQIVLAGVIVPDLPRVADFIAHTVVSGFWIYKAMASILSQDRHEVSRAISVLLLHTAICFAAACLILFVRDARGEMVYGRAIGRWVKQASRAGGKPQTAPGGE
jgi:hypothetical protein